MNDNKSLTFSLYKHGILVFGSEKSFTKWLNSKNIIFDNKMPKEFLNTIEGIKFVDDRLTAIEYGDTI